ncbi:MAG: Rieske 2Fe-2S domain-containing protein [Betaproteobacteria bacterium]|nr:MAG: Rieske 2Fe-2S domain-containing protein [Betaproteobacteria bacterium]
MSTSIFFEHLVQEDRVHRSIYTDPLIFELEMTHIFGGVWCYLAHESQLPRPDDYLTGKLGLRPIIVVRDSSGKLRALFNRCTHRGARVCRETRGSARTFQCPYHGWTYFNTGKLRGVPWPEGYACDFAEGKYNLAQVPRVESYRGFIFGTLNADAPPLGDYLGAAKRPIDEWLDRNPGSRVVVAEANRLKFKGNWKLAYDNAADGYHVVFSHRSLLETENRHAADPTKGMSFYMGKPDEAPMYVQYFGRGHHFKDKRPNVERRPGALWEIEGAQPGMAAYEKLIRERLGARALRALDLAASEPVNINIFPNLSILGNHIQVFQPLAVDETESVWYATAIVDEANELEGMADAVNAIRMRTQESFPNFGEVDDAANFEEIQKGLAACEDEWVYMHRGLGIPGRVQRLADGTLKAPATDEVFMREHMKEWQRLMTTRPNIQLSR